MMTQLSRRWAMFVVAYRAAILAFTALVIMLAPLSFKNLYHDNSNESFFLKNDPHLEAFNALIDKFGDPEYLLVGVRARDSQRDVFEARTISVINDITHFLEEHVHVTQVRSLSKYQFTHDSSGMMATDDLFEDIEELNENPQLLDEARAIIRSERLAMESLVTRDLRHARIIARTVYMHGENQHKVQLIHDLLGFLREKKYQEQGFSIHLAGVPVIGERFETLTQDDMQWINPTMGVIMIAILLVVFRSFFAMLVPVVMILATMLLITGVQGVLKWPITAVNSALIPTTIILTMGTAVHVLVEFFQFRYMNIDPKEAAIKTVNDLFFAVLFTCITTSMGFIALSVTELTPVRQFAVLAAIAPLIIFIISMSTLPAILSYVSWLPRRDKESSETSWVRKLTSAVPDITYNNRKFIGLIGVILTLFSFYGASKIRVDANVVNYFKENSWVHKDLLYFNENFKGISNLEIVVDSGSEGGVKNPEFLRRVEDLQNWISDFDETGKANSILDFYKQINQALNEDDNTYFRLPSSREMAAQFLLLYENTGPEEDLSDLKDFNEQFLRIQVPMVNMNESETSNMLATLNQGILRNFGDLKIELTGTLVMNNAQNRYVNEGMFRSFSIAILVIGLSFIILFKSLKYGLIALIPSVIPVLITGAIISFAGISLDLGTMIVGAMTIGIAVDDSIHVMSRYLLKRKRGMTVRDSIASAMDSSGRAVVLTSIILVAGFSVMLLGSFVSYIYVGLFSAMIMSLALIGDLIFMPAIIYLIDGERDEEHRETLVSLSD